MFDKSVLGVDREVLFLFLVFTLREVFAFSVYTHRYELGILVCHRRVTLRLFQILAKVPECPADPSPGTKIEVTTLV